MKEKIKFIINPRSGVGKKEQLPSLINNYLDLSKFDYDISYTKYRKHANKLAKEAALAGYAIVCAVGGDGSVHEVGTALIGSETKMAIIPVGSGNGLARHLKVPLKIKEAIKAINSGKSISMDTGLVNDKPFLGTGGYGFDALIAKKFDLTNKRGFIGYAKLVAKEYLKYKPVNVTIEFPDTKQEIPVVLCSLANSSEFGNGFSVSPESNISDGQMELCIIKPFSAWRLPFLIYRFFKKTTHKSSSVDIIPFTKVRIFIETNFAHYDGEPFKVRKELNVEVKPKSLNIVVGPKYKTT
jgi:diacylglycerol kinase (ATP)